MSYGTAKLAQYRELEIMTLSPARRLVLLYTHLLSNLRQANATTPSPSAADRLPKLMKAHAILEELRYTLDMEQGGEIATSLAGLYDLFMAEVLRDIRTPDAARLDRVISQLTELHEAFSSAADMLENTAAMLPTAASA